MKYPLIKALFPRPAAIIPLRQRHITLRGMPDAGGDCSPDRGGGPFASIRRAANPIALRKLDPRPAPADPRKRGAAVQSFAYKQGSAGCPIWCSTLRCLANPFLRSPAAPDERTRSGMWAGFLERSPEVAGCSPHTQLRRRRGCPPYTGDNRGYLTVAIVCNGRPAPLRVLREAARCPFPQTSLQSSSGTGAGPRMSAAAWPSCTPTLRPGRGRRTAPRTDRRNMPGTRVPIFPAQYGAVFPAACCATGIRSGVTWT